MSGRVRAVFHLVQRAEAAAKPTLSNARAVLDRYTAIEEAAMQPRPIIAKVAFDAMLAEIKVKSEESDACGEDVLIATNKIGALLRAKETRMRSFWGRWAQSPDFDAEIRRLKTARMALETQHREAQRSLQKAVSTEASARRTHKEAIVLASANHDRASKLSKMRLAMFGRARKLLDEWPALAHCGLQRVLAMAWRVDKMREKGWDPGPQVNDLRMR